MAVAEGQAVAQMEDVAAALEVLDTVGAVGLEEVGMVEGKAEAWVVEEVGRLRAETVGYCAPYLPRPIR